MNDDQEKHPSELVNVLINAMDKKIYGSVEFYFEAGRVTQVTQRIINKINRVQKAKKTTKKFTQTASYTTNSQLTRER